MDVHALSLSILWIVSERFFLTARFVDGRVRFRVSLLFVWKFPGHVKCLRILHFSQQRASKGMAYRRTGFFFFFNLYGSIFSVAKYLLLQGLSSKRVSAGIEVCTEHTRYSLCRLQNRKYLKNITVANSCKTTCTEGQSTRLYARTIDFASLDTPAFV